MHTMMPSRSSIVTAALMIVVAGAACTLIAADRAAPVHRHAEDLQRLVGGLGCGPAVDLSRCAFSFDPRLCADCSLNYAPVPGSCFFCPQHACSILYCRPLTSAADRIEEVGDGRAP